MGKMLFLKGLNLVWVLFAVMALLGVVLGGTGFSDRRLSAAVNEELRGMRMSLAQGIRDPEELKRVLTVQKEELESFYGLDTPWYYRLPWDIARVMMLDMGEAQTLRSFEGSSRVSDIILERLPNTMILMLTNFFFVAAIALGAGAYLATKAGSKTDRVVSIFSVGSSAIPVWWLGIIVILIFSVKLQILPSGGMHSVPPPEGTWVRFFDLLKHAVSPVLSLVLVGVGAYLYTIRTMTLKTAQEDFVTFARAKGFSEMRVRWRYILRPAAPSILTGLVLGFAGSFSGAILTETVFRWPGMGRLYFDAVVGTPDEGLIVALTFIFTLIYLGARFILDILYLWADPRIRYESQ